MAFRQKTGLQSYCSRDIGNPAPAYLPFSAVSLSDCHPASLHFLSDKFSYSPDSSGTGAGCYEPYPVSNRSHTCEPFYPPS